MEIKHKAIRLAAALIVMGVAGTAWAGPRPVVVELFTSHGCSSCPPADALLRKLPTAPPAADIQVIALSEHVDYWDSLGWPDRFASARFSRRQRHYANTVFGSGRVYTPQMVVNGRREMVGSHGGEVRAAIREAAGQADLPVALKLAPTDNRVQVSVTVDSTGLDNEATVWVALTQNNVSSDIGGGENAGRVLREDGVVRVFQRLGRVPAHTSTAKRYQQVLTMPANTQPRDLAVTVFVQRTANQAIVGAAREPLVADGA